MDVFIKSKAPIQFLNLAHTNTKKVACIPSWLILEF